MADSVRKAAGLHARPGGDPEDVSMSAVLSAVALDSRLKEELRARGLSVATPGMTGRHRTEALKKRLAAALQKEMTHKWSAQQLDSATRMTAFKEFIKEKGGHRLDVLKRVAPYRPPLVVTADGVFGLPEQSTKGHHKTGKLGLRRQSDIAKAKAEALTRAKQRVESLYAAPAELELVEFYIKHDKYAEAQEVLMRVLKEQKDKLPEGHHGLLRSQGLWEYVQAGLAMMEERYLMEAEDLRQQEKGSVSDATRTSTADLVAIVNNDRWLGMLRRFARREKTYVRIRFLISVWDFKMLPDEALPAAASVLYATFIKNVSVLPSVPMVIRGRVEKAMAKGTSPLLFDEVEEVVVDSVLRGTLVRFLRTKTGQKFKAERAAERAAVMGVPAAGAGVYGEASESAGASWLGSLEDRAATMLQKLWRGYQGRLYVREVVRGTYTKHLDADSGYYYYLNAYTGESSWYPPLGMEDAVDADQYLPLTDAGTPYCVECEEFEATRHCHQCEDNYCTTCYDRIHAKGARSRHLWSYVVLPEGVVVSPVSTVKEEPVTSPYLYKDGIDSRPSSGGPGVEESKLDGV